MAQPGLPPTTFIQAFELFYTRFILRDFVGKIVPGLIFIFLSFMATHPDFSTLKNLRRINFIEAVTLLSVAWLFTLCSQSIYSRISYFYFPRLKIDLNIKRYGVNRKKEVIEDKPMAFYLFSFRQREAIYARELCEAYNFLKDATPDERAQYERYVVIKEACGNAFFCTLLGILSFCAVTFFETKAWKSPFPFSPFTSAIGDSISEYPAQTIILLLWMQAARLMKKDNLLRQTTFIEYLRERTHLHKKEFISIFRSRSLINIIYGRLRGQK